jgi:dUTP pyrophosphatase
MDNTPKIKLVKAHPEARLPVANNIAQETGDTGYDVYCVETAYISPKSSTVVEVGLTVGYIQPGYWIQIMPRSGLGFSKGIQPHLGVIDNQYRGNLSVKLYNFSDNPVSIKKGDRIAQLVIHQLHQASFSFTDEVEDTSRGSKGFGSSGK